MKKYAFYLQKGTTTAVIQFNTYALIPAVHQVISMRLFI